MKIEMPPDFIPSEEIFKIIIEELEKAAGKDTQKIMNELYHENPPEDKFMRTLAYILRRYLPASRINAVLTRIRDRIQNLVRIEVNKEEIVIPKNGHDYLKVYVENNMGATARFKVSVVQKQKERTAIIYDPKTATSHTKLAKAIVIENGRAHTFRFMIKPGIFMINDLHDLKKKKEVSFDLIIKVESNYDVVKLPNQKVKVIIKDFIP